jgi:hypothetical protein
MTLFVYGSSPVVGSSNTISLALLETIATAIEILLYIPPDSCFSSFVLQERSPVFNSNLVVIFS